MVGSLIAGLLPRNLALIWLIFVFAPYILAYFLLKRSAKNMRIRHGSPPSREVLQNQKISSRIAWEEIKTVSLIRRKSLRISVGIHVYRATIKKQDYEPLKTFLLSKIGERLSAREGTF